MRRKLDRDIEEGSLLYEDYPLVSRLTQAGNHSLLS